MTGAIERRRNSPAMFAVRAAENATTIVPTCLVWLSVRTKWPVVFGIPVDVIVGLVSGIVVLSLVVDWWMTRFTVGVGGVSFDRGLVVRRSTSLAWSEVVSVQVSRSAACRVLGCARVVIGVGTQSEAGLVIEAVPEAVAAEIEGYFEAGRDRPVAGTDQPVADQAAAVRPDGDDLIYRIRVRDYFMLSVTYGQFVLVVPFGFELYDNIAALFSVSWVLPELSLWVLVVTVLAVAVPVAVGFGMSVAWLRYRSFEVRLRGGVFAMSGGLVSAESRQVSRSQVMGIKIQQNPLMRATGYARLSFVSRQSGERIGANIVFPAARLPFLRDGIRTHFPAYAAAADRSCTPSRPLTWGLAGVAVATLGLALAAVARMPAVRAVVVMTVVAIALLATSNHCWAAARLDPENGVIHFRRGFLWVTEYVVPSEAVYYVHSHQAAPTRRLSAATVCLGVYDTRPVRLCVPVGRPTLVDQFVEATAGTSTNERRRRPPAPSADADCLADGVSGAVGQ